MPTTRTVEIPEDRYHAIEGLAQRLNSTVTKGVTKAIDHFIESIADGRGLTKTEAMKAIEPFLADAVTRTANALGVMANRIGINQTTGEIIIYVQDGDAITIPPPPTP